MNKYEALEIRDFNGFSDFFCEFERLCRENNFDDHCFVSVYAGREFIYAVLMEFMKPELIDKWEVGLIDFVSRDIDGADYDCEYCLYCNGDGSITVDFARDDITDTPYSIEYEIAFIYQEDCGQDIVDKALDGDSNRTILFGTDADQSEQSTSDVKITTFWSNEWPQQFTTETRLKSNSHTAQFSDILNDIDKLKGKINDLMAGLAQDGV